MKTPNKKLLNSLAEFAANVEGPTEDLSSAEIAEKLQFHGVDLMRLDAHTVRKLRKLRGQLEPFGGLKGLIVNQRTKREPLIASINGERAETGDASEQGSDEERSGPTPSGSE